MEPQIQVNSEIGRLKTVLLHRPGEELEALTPEYMSRMLFDDVPYLKVAQEEHDAFANVLRENGIKMHKGTLSWNLNGENAGKFGVMEET